MLLAALFVLSGIAAAFSFLSAFFKKLTAFERLAVAVPLGTIVSAWIAFLSALAFNEAGYLQVAIASVILAIAAIAAHSKAQNELHEILAESGEHKRLLFLLAVTLLVFGYLLSTHVLEQRPDGIYSAGSTWGDLGIHLTLINSFLHGVNSQPALETLAYPPFAGAKLTYTFLPDFHSAALVAGGMSVRDSIIVPSLLMALALVALLYFFALRFTGSKKAAAIAVPIALLAGGIGFLDLPGDAAAAGKDLPAYLAELPHDYVHSTGKQSLYWLSFTNDLLLPQRSSLYGFPLSIAAFMLLLMALESENGERRKYFLLAGAIAGFLPFVQAHALIAILIVAAVVFTLNFRKPFGKYLVEWLHFGAPIALLAGPQLLYFAGQASKLGIARYAPLWGTNSILLGPAAFWLKNLGLFFVLAVAGIAFLSDKQKKFYAGFLAVFAIAGLFIFQPWEQDNTKLLYQFVVGAAPVVAIALEKIFSAKPKMIVSTAAAKIIPIILFAAVFTALVLSGALAILRESQLHFFMYSQEDLQLGEWARGNTPPNAVFLTSDWHLHPVPALAGRQVLMGYRGWLWSHGFDYRGREEKTRRIYAGGGDTIALLRGEGIDYAVIGENELRDYAANKPFFENAFGKAFENAKYAVYKTS